MAKDYLKRFTLFALLLPLPVVAINLLMDPFGAFGFVTIGGFNNIKPEAEKNEKLAKSMRVAVIEPKVVILGTSRAEFGLDPAHPGFARYGPAYNLAVADSSVYVTRRYLQHAITVADLEAVILGLDFFAFNELRPQAPDYREEYLAVTPDGHGNPGYLLAILTATTFSLDSLLKGLSTVWNGRSHSGPSVDVDSGVRASVSDGHPVDLRVHVKNAWRTRIDPDPATDAWSSQTTFRRSDYQYINGGYFRGPRNEYRFEDPDSNRSSFYELRQILRLCGEHDIDLYLVISPTHARQMEITRQTGLWPLFEHWKRLLVASVTEAEAKWNRKIPLWDFSGYNRITTEPVPPHGYMDHYLDTAHYQVTVGDLILDRVFGSADPDAATEERFGARLTEKTVERVLSQIRRNQKEYQRQKEKDVAEIAALIEDSRFAYRKVSVTGSGTSMAAEVGLK